MSRKEIFFYMNEVKLSWTWMLLAAFTRVGLLITSEKKYFLIDRFSP